MATAKPSGRRPLAIDLFAGVGGLSLGLEQAGFDVRLAVERDPFHVAAYRRNFPNTTILVKSVSSLTGRELLSAAGDQDIDLLCGGPPCQGFSPMGKRRPGDPRNGLVKHFVRLVQETSPKSFLIENVPGIRSGATGRMFDAVVQQLSTKYEVTTPFQILNAADFGVPQQRERLFVLGVRKDLGTKVSYPSISSRRPRPTVWDAIRDLPSLASREDLFSSDLSTYRKVPLDRLHSYARIARSLKKDRTDFSQRRTWNRDVCSGCLRVRHRPDIERLYAATAPGASVPSHHLPRLNPAGIAPTLRAGTDSEHGSFNAPRPIHPYEPRCITVREAARLHGFPDWFGFFPAKWHAHRQIGNSVCPPVARAIGAELMDALDAVPSKPKGVLHLTDAFQVQSGGQKRSRRIQQLREFPRILERLLKDARRAKDGTLVKPDFSVADVAAAYRRVAAKMPRTPPGRFLEDIARSRNRRTILAAIRKAGLSILPIGRNGVYGRFVPVNTLGTIDVRQSLAISSSDLSQARRIVLTAQTAQAAHALVNHLRRPSVVQALFGARTRVQSLDPANPAPLEKRCVYPVAFINGQRRVRNGVVTTTSCKDLPDLSALQALAERFGVDTCIVLAPITRRHFAAIAVRSRSGKPPSMRRQVFEVARRATSRFRAQRYSKAARS